MNSPEVDDISSTNDKPTSKEEGLVENGDSGNKTKSNHAGFSEAESLVLDEAIDFFKSDIMNSLREAYKNGNPIEYKYNGKTIGYEPDLPITEGYSAMTISPHQLDPITLKPLGESGWYFGPRAFTSEMELRKTILQELHRLNFSDVVKTGGAGGGTAKTSTKNAFQFAEDGWNLIE